MHEHQDEAAQTQQDCPPLPPYSAAVRSPPPAYRCPLPHIAPPYFPVPAAEHGRSTAVQLRTLESNHLGKKRWGAGEGRRRAGQRFEEETTWTC